MVSEKAVERPPVTREAVVDAALRLLAEGGLEVVSFRRIAKALGVAGPTLYWHVDSKRQLMDLMAEELVARNGRAYEGPEPGQPWWEWLREDAQRMFEALIATRDAPRVVAGNRPSPDAFPGIERVLAVLVDDAGMSAGDAQEALFAIGAYVIGSATEWQAEAERAQQQPLPDPSDDRLNALRAEILSDQPLLQDAILERLGRPPTSAFEFGLDLLIGGMRARYSPAD